MAPIHDLIQPHVAKKDSGWIGTHGLVAVLHVVLDNNKEFDMTVAIQSFPNLKLLLVMAVQACMDNGQTGLSAVKNVPVESADVTNIMIVEMNQLLRRDHVVLIDGLTGHSGHDALPLVPVSTYEIF